MKRGAAAKLPLASSFIIMASTTTDFLNAIGRYPLLTTEQEIMLGHEIQDWMSLRDKDSPTIAERRIMRKGERAYRKFYLSNLRLVVSVCRKYFPLIRELPGGFDQDDLLQEGCIGLSRAIEKFDPSRGYKFSTYAYWWIRQAIGRSLDQSITTIKLPIGWRNDLQKILSLSETYRQKHGKRPTVEYLAKETGVSLDRAQAMIQLGGRITSLDAELAKTNDGDTHAILDLIADDKSRPMEDVESSESQERIIKAMKSLTDAQRDILERYYGMNGHPSMTFGEIGEQMDRNRESIRLNVRKAQTRLRFLLGMQSSHQEDLFRTGRNGGVRPMTLRAPNAA